ncbi:VPS28-domain-containing protein [Ophiobolus disseminans]|uniref:VPS28-domain-containing protein n=1 Tax=Ophiobolus disseminans TaxID=1469910 RepID=A0A6A6ZI27_9PLEO|nr:VPS28-domain-containing protein [Ophiobolus disseminans]
MYNTRQLAYAPTPYIPRSALSATINLDEEVKLSTTNAERDLNDSLAEIYSIIVTLDALEKAYLKDSISEVDYTGTCSRLLKQYKSNLANEAVARAFGDLDSFAREWDMECPRAIERLRVGIPATVEQGHSHGSGQQGDFADATLVVNATETFITLLDAIKIGLVEKDTLHPLLVEIIQAVNKVTDKDFESKGKIVQWLITLNQMRAADKLDDEQAREFEFDMQQAYHGFNRHSCVSQHPAVRNCPAVAPTRTGYLTFCEYLQRWTQPPTVDICSLNGMSTLDVQVNPEGVTRYLTSIVSSSLRWIDDDDVKEEIWNQASIRLSERSGRTAMGAISRKFRIPSHSGSFELDIHEPTLTGDDLGLKTWAASYLLAKRLHTMDLVQPKPQERLQVLELGSGTGLVGLAMAGLGADVVLTDLPSINSNLAHNADTNSDTVARNGGSVRTGILDWTQPTVCHLNPSPAGNTEAEMLTSKFPLILAADSLYSPEHPHMLVDSIEVWLSNEGDARVIVEFPYRDAYLPEIATFRDRMMKFGLGILEQGEEKGYDDWGSTAGNGDDDEESIVTCWWSIWGRCTIDGAGA